jgi:hypothetical protein
MRRLSQRPPLKRASKTGNALSSIEDRASAKMGNRCGTEIA